MVKNLRVWLGDGTDIVFKGITHSWIVGTHLLFTQDQGGNNSSGINMDEVIAWEFFGD